MTNTLNLTPGDYAELREGSHLWKTLVESPTLGTTEKYRKILMIWG